MKRVNFHLTVVQRERLESLSSETGLSVAELIRRAVDAMLDERQRRQRSDVDRQETPRR